MQILLDENVPIQVQPILDRVLRGHVVSHVDDIQWKGKKDRSLLKDAAAKGFDLIITKDRSQLADLAESKAIKRSGLHHVRFTQGAGLKGLARATAAVVAAMPDVVEELEGVQGQRLVAIQGIRPARRFNVRDPAADPPPYWPRGGGLST